MNEIGKVQSGISNLETQVSNAKYPVYTLSKTFALGANTWTNTGIFGQDLPTGTYIIEFYPPAQQVSKQLWSEHFSGVMYWFSGGTNNTNATNITLHFSGHANNRTTIQARTLRSAKTDAQPYVKLQLYSNMALEAAEWIFKFTKIM